MQSQPGVYGVPSFLIDGQLFWGDDMFDMMLEWLNDPSMLDHPEAKRITALEPAAERRRQSAASGSGSSTCAK